jgi:hypothetical protein
MLKYELNGALLFAQKNASLLVMLGDTEHEVPVSSGVHMADDLVSVLPDNADIDFVNIEAVKPPSRTRVMRTKKHSDSGANPDFEPTNEYRDRERMRVMTQRIARESNRLLRQQEGVSKMLADAQSLVAKPQPDADPEPVLGDGPDPQGDPKPKPKPKPEAKKKGDDEAE